MRSNLTLRIKKDWRFSVGKAGKPDGIHLSGGSVFLHKALGDELIHLFPELSELVGGRLAQFDHGLKNFRELF